MRDLGDREAGQAFDWDFESQTLAGVLTTLSGPPELWVFKGNSTTPTQDGIILTVDFAGQVGINHVHLDTSANATFYTNGFDYTVKIKIGNVSSVDVAYRQVAYFSLANRAGIKPSMPGTRLLVTAAGKVTTGTLDDKTGMRLSAPGVQDIWEPQTTAMVTNGSIGKRVVDTMTHPIEAVPGLMFKKGTGYTRDDADPQTVVYEIAGVGVSVDEVAAAVWDRLLTTFLTPGSVGELVKTVLPLIDAAVSSRLAAAGYTPPLNAAAVRSAVGLASPNLDVQFAALPTAADNATAVAAQVTTDHGVGSYARNTEPDNASISAIKTNTDLIPAGGPASAADVLAKVNEALQTAVADSIPADGAPPSIAQGVYMLTQFHSERGVSGNLLTIYKPDGVTPLMVLTLNDPTTPTRYTRTT